MEPQDYQSLVRPIVEVSNDVARTTAEIATQENVDLVIAEGQPETEFSFEFNTAMARLLGRVRNRIITPTVRASAPIRAVVEASATVDLTIAGASREGGSSGKR